MVCMARVPFSNGRISTHFDDIHLKLSTYAYFEVRFHSILSKYKNDIISDELCLCARGELSAEQAIRVGFCAGDSSRVLHA